MWRDQPRDVPEVDPDTDGRKYWHYFFAHGQSFHGVATPIRDTPRDDLSIQKSNGRYINFTSLGPRHMVYSPRQAKEIIWAAQIYNAKV